MAHLVTCSDRVAYQTYNDVQSINAQRRDMWDVIAEARFAVLDELVEADRMEAVRAAANRITVRLAW